LEGEKLSVLIVDDAVANRTVLAALLKRAGYAAAAAASSAEAERLFRSECPDAVLTDLHLEGGEDGVTLAKRLRALAGGRTVRMALMTADAGVPPEAHGLFDAMIEKPVSLADITAFLGDKTT